MTNEVVLDDEGTASLNILESTADDDQLSDDVDDVVSRYYEMRYDDKIFLILYPFVNGQEDLGVPLPPHLRLFCLIVNSNPVFGALTT
jgi:hypothetical protein